MIHRTMQGTPLPTTALAAVSVLATLSLSCPREDKPAPGAASSSVARRTADRRPPRARLKTRTSTAPPRPTPGKEASKRVLPQPVCAWNHAYEEDSHNDSIAAILAGARGCYVLIDPFESAGAREAIPRIKAAGNVVGCYVSIGSCEKWRKDYRTTKPHCGPAYPGWEGETYVIDTAGILPAIKARIDKMASWGCQMVEFDNMDWAFHHNKKITVTPDEARRYNRTVCAHTRARKMMCMAKNTTDGAEDFDGLTVESYTHDKNWWTASHLHEILAAGKLGLIVHYKDESCAKARASYRKIYGEKVSFLCSDKRRYRLRK
jgi:endo-alpha-1,4-polygalactosaminidase (GH114 family)